MVRRAARKPVTAQMYRHFAAVTLAVTLVVGIFADGESRKAVASEVSAPRPVPRAGPSQIIRKDPAARGSFASFDEAPGDFGAPMDTAGAAVQDGLIPDPSQDDNPHGAPAGLTRYGMSAQAFAALSDAQKKMVIARHQAELAAAQSPDRPQQISGLLAASRARSGEASLED